MRWRARLHLLHRDVGFLCLGMTLIYGVSGVAVNHREHWDYNTTTEVARLSLGPAATLLGRPEDSREPAALAQTHRTELVLRLLRAVGRTEPPRVVLWRGARLSLFFGPGETDVLDYTPTTGLVEQTSRRERWLFRQLNFLHLNEAHGSWTYVADLYAGALLFLGLSGVLMVRSRRGLRGRGGLLVLLGIIVPVVAYLLLR